MWFWMEAMRGVLLCLCKCVPIGNDLVRLACIKCKTNSHVKFVSLQIRTKLRSSWTFEGDRLAARIARRAREARLLDGRSEVGQ